VGELSHVPLVAESVLPTVSRPMTSGMEVLTGAAGGAVDCEPVPKMVAPMMAAAS